MNTISCVFAVVTLAASALAQYNGGYNGNYNQNYDNNNNNQGAYNNKYVGPQIAILNHKQALGTDGSFNYAFNADNGIQQGESISPDGTRQGSYSYVDPNGKTVSLKYVAGKEGFRVLEGDHIPRAVPLPPQHAAAYKAAAAQAAEVAYRNPSSQGQYQQGSSAPYRQAYNVDEGDDSGSYSEPSNQNYRSSYSSADEPSYNNGPHSFGNGFAFEFGGGRY